MWFRLVPCVLVAAALLAGDALLAAGADASPIRRGPSQATRQVQRAIEKNVLLRVQRMQVKLRVEKSAGPVRAMDMDAGGRYLATASADRTVRLWDLQLGRQTMAFRPHAAPIATVRLTPDGLYVVALDDAGTVGLWNAATEAFERTLASAVAAIAVSPEGSVVVTGGTDGVVRLYRIAGEPNPIALGRPGAAVTAVDIGPTGQFVLSGAADGTVRIWEVNSGAAVATFKGAGAPVSAVRFGRDETEFFSADRSGNVFRWMVGSDRPAGAYTGASGAIGTIDVRADAGKLLAADAGGRLLSWPIDGAGGATVIIAHDGGVAAARFDGSASRVISAGADGLTKVWSLDTPNRPLASLVSTEKGWAVVDDAGRFDGSDRAMRNVQWASETQVLPVENFSTDFFEPGLLAKKRLGDSMITSPEVPIGEGVLPPPSAAIGAPAEITLARRQPIEVTVEAVDQGGGVEEVRLYHNGKIVDPGNVATRGVVKRDDQDVVSVVYRVDPVAGRNVFNANAVSSERVVGVTASSAVQVVAPLRRPTLHVLTIGVNTYKEFDLSLNYALQDAEGIADAVRKGAGDIFGEVKSYPVFDAEATGPGILAALDVLAATAPEDVVVIYYAGHGESLGEEFYLLPYEFPLPFTDQKLAEYGVPATALRERITRIGARRVLFLLDACKSGTAVESFADYRDRRTLHRLGSAVGLFIVAATAKEQLAAELGTLGHGVFTYTLIQGLSGQADDDPRDGNLTVRELVYHAEDKVPFLSREYANHQQWPLVYAQGLDFTLRRAQ